LKNFILILLITILISACTDQDSCSSIGDNAADNYVQLLNSQESKLWVEIKGSFDEYLELNDFKIKDDPIATYINFLELQPPANNIPTPAIEFNERNIELKNKLTRHGILKNATVTDTLLLLALKSELDSLSTLIDSSCIYQRIYSYYNNYPFSSPALFAENLENTIGFYGSERFAEIMTIQIYLFGFITLEELKLERKKRTKELITTLAIGT
jgi:hypothetical protein